MDRQTLIATAAALPAFPPSAANAYAAAREQLVATVNRLLGARPDIDRLLGPDNREMMANNHANHARFVETVLADLHPEMLVDTVLWVFRAYRSHGFSLAYWPAQLNAWLDAMSEHLGAEDAAAIEPLYRWFIVQQPAFTSLSDAQLADGI